MNFWLQISELLGIFTNGSKMTFLKKIICTEYLESQRGKFPMFFKMAFSERKYRTNITYFIEHYVNFAKISVIFDQTRLFDPTSFFVEGSLPYHA